MHRTMFRSKIHRATVTHANLHYVGSVTIDIQLLEAADILPGELVSIVDVTNGSRLETYTIAGERESGVVGINGAAAHLIHEGDLVIVITYASMNENEARTFHPTVVHVDRKNALLAVGTDPSQALTPSTKTPPQAVMSRTAEGTLKVAYTSQTFNNEEPLMLEGDRYKSSKSNC